nr:dienelactone hydrolase family protein [uncultured Sphingomonas sp.]
MCDDRTIAEDLDWLRTRGMTRRSFAAAAGATAIAAGLPGCTTTAKDGSPLFETMVSVPTADGTADAFFVHPSKGRHPAILLWPDIGGLREAFKEASRQLAASGYAVLAVNHYYRGSKAPVLPEGVSFRDPQGREILGPMIAALTPDAYAGDAKAYVAWLDAQRAVDTDRKVGSVGHCMTGSTTIRAAAAVPARVAAAVSFHGGGLVTDKADSPHLLIPSTSAAFLFAIAQNDDAKEPNTKTVLRDTAARAKRPAEVEVYPAQHGWTTLDSAVYDPVQAARAWTRAKSLFAQL